MTRFWMILLLYCPAVVLAQQSSSMPDMSAMDHTGAAKMIQGSADPSAIPDNTAYRLYFIAIGNPPNPTDHMKARQKTHIAKMSGMSDADKAGLITVMDDFKVRFKVMTDAYNAQVEAAVKIGATLPDVNAFFALRDQLVTDQRARLKVALTAEGLAQLDANIQNEKKGMAIAAPQEEQ